MKSISSDNYDVLFSGKGYQFVNQFIKDKNPSSIFILSDSNTRKYCVPIFFSKLEEKNIQIIEIPTGEEFKNIETCVEVWNTLTDLGADRKSLLLNVGGGVITDLGGFVASCFKRGISFINVPTTLLSMVDASVGGKTGVDLGVLKNQVGVFANPKTVVVDTTYLETLSEREFSSGMAEIIKYGFTFDIHLWEKVRKMTAISDKSLLEEVIYQSINIKNEVVTKDPKENSLRKVLNYGHTLGHAIESYFLESEHKEKLTHGEAIAVGMITATYISSEILGFSKDKLSEITADILKMYPKIPLLKVDFEPIITLLKHDKKNVKGEVRFVLLNDFEDFKLDCVVPESVVLDSLNYYLKF
ncbi:MAG: 3-dehydroquinate synthase [Flavobacteriaceae bacterium]|nr:3-dehydroquinate synthase [Flavobacteriaceae bacterium]